MEPENTANYQLLMAWPACNVASQFFDSVGSPITLEQVSSSNLGPCYHYAGAIHRSNVHIMCSVGSKTNGSTHELIYGYWGVRLDG